MTPVSGSSVGHPVPDHSVVPPVWGRITNIDVDHGEGSWLITPDGDRYLDYSSGIGVTNTGHAHPRVVAAVQAQAAKLLHGQQNIVYHEPGLRLHERLSRLLPGGPWGAFLSNSGAEAVEAAVKLARVATGRPVIISFRGGFHGRTAQTMALTTAKDVYRAAFEPLPGSIYHTRFPYCYQAAGGGHAPDANCTCDWEAELDLLFHQVIYPNRVAAIIVEPVQGEGGYIVPPPTFLPRLREITRLHGILLIADEVQTGFGRTGEMFAVQHWGVEPDILVMAKGIASGMPLSGIVAHREILDMWALGPTVAPTAATSCRVRPRWPPSMSSRTRTSLPTLEPVGHSSRVACASSRPIIPSSATCADSAAWWPWNWSSPRSAMDARPTRISPGGSSPERWNASSSFCRQGRTATCRGSFRRS